MIESRLKARNLVGRTIMEFPLQIVMSDSHPLAKYDDVPYELLSEYPEIIHGDDEPEMVRRAAINQDYDEKRSTKRILIYDRGTQISMLKTVKNAYMWVSPVPKQAFPDGGVVMKKCSYANIRMRDLVVCKKTNENNRLIKEFIEFMAGFVEQSIGTEEE